MQVDNYPLNHKNVAVVNLKVTVVKRTIPIDVFKKLSTLSSSRFGNKHFPFLCTFGKFPLRQLSGAVSVTDCCLGGRRSSSISPPPPSSSQPPTVLTVSRSRSRSLRDAAAAASCRQSPARCPLELHPGGRTGQEH